VGSESFPTGTLRRFAVALAAAACLTAFPTPGTAQYVLKSPSGDSLVFETATLRAMLDTTRALYADLEEDPLVLYRTPLERPNVVTEASPESSYPWNVVAVETDSSANLVQLPANLREADRAFYNYAVMRMRVVRGEDPDVSCDSVLALEERVVGSFADGWILSRTLFGGPAFAPLDELAFAREAGLLRPMLAARNDRQVGACAEQWAHANPDRIAQYEAWRKEHFPLPAEEGGTAADSTGSQPEQDPPDAAEPETQRILEAPDGNRRIDPE
jgi:hypothetical protein